MSFLSEGDAEEHKPHASVPAGDASSPGETLASARLRDTYPPSPPRSSADGEADQTHLKMAALTTCVFSHRSSKPFTT